MTKYRIEYEIERIEHSYGYAYIEAKSLKEAKKKAKQIEQYEREDFHNAMDNEEDMEETSENYELVDVYKDDDDE